MNDIDGLNIDDLYELLDDPMFATPKADAIVYVNAYLNTEYPEASKIKNGYPPRDNILIGFYKFGEKINELLLGNIHNDIKQTQLRFTGLQGYREFLNKEIPLSPYEGKVNGIRNLELLDHLQANNPDLFPYASKNALLSSETIETFLIQKGIYDKKTRKKQRRILHETGREDDVDKALRIALDSEDDALPSLPTLETIYESDEDLSQLPDSHFPTIDKSLYDSKWIYETFNNKVFTCTEKAFNAWLVYGKIYPEKIEWLLIYRNGKKNFAQLKLFIHTITKSDDAKEKYFNTVFGERVTADIRKSTSFCKELKAIGTIKDSIKGGLRK
jgi:hypothetical protein